MPCTLKCSGRKMTFSYSATIPLFTYKLGIISLCCLHWIRITFPSVPRGHLSCSYPSTYRRAWQTDQWDGNEGLDERTGVDGKPHGFWGGRGRFEQWIGWLVDALGPACPQGGQVWGMVRVGLLWIKQQEGRLQSKLKSSFMVSAWPNGVSTLFPFLSETKISSCRSSSVASYKEIWKVLEFVAP